MVKQSPSLSRWRCLYFGPSWTAANVFTWRQRTRSQGAMTSFSFKFEARQIGRQQASLGSGGLLDLGPIAATGSIRWTVNSNLIQIRGFRSLFTGSKRCSSIVPRRFLARGLRLCPGLRPDGSGDVAAHFRECTAVRGGERVETAVRYRFAGDRVPRVRGATRRPADHPDRLN